MNATFKKYVLDFKIPGGTSRGILRTKETFFLKITDDSSFGIGECNLFKGLSIDDVPDYEGKLQWLCDNIRLDQAYLLRELRSYPSIQFGLEQALLSLNSPQSFELFPSKFTKGEDSVLINGLIWMGDKNFMQDQIQRKLQEGFTTIKLKIGAIDFDTELNLIKLIRNQYSVKDVEIRVDANGAFSSEQALEKLKRLSDFDIHSIEQPIRVKQWEQMAKLCELSPLAIALDEELIGIFDNLKKVELLKKINPQYIILKPSLIGGYRGTAEWIQAAEQNNCSWWITSALESNIGLNAIAQFTYTLQTKMPQGLGTGSLFTNNIESPLKVKNGALYYLNKNKYGKWANTDFLFI